VEKSYQKGVDYNDTIALAKKQKELGFKAKIKFENSGNNHGILLVEILDKNSQEINNANIHVFLKRPTQEGFDFDVPLIFADGKYQAKISFPLKGQWDFNLEAVIGEDVFYEVKRYIIQ
jgi:nitrogen fixation protein FixH